MSRTDTQRKSRPTESEPPVAAEVSHSDGEPAVSYEATPSMAQYLEIKAANPDSLLWYRMGDFYELFFEDAVTASEALSIVLTKRGKHRGQDIPMCGVPVHRADEYLQRLIKKGYRVAVCEQLEDPAEARKRGAKAVVKRDVVRLVTPGTLTEEALLDAKTSNYLTAVFVPKPSSQGSEGAESRVALASLDISTGEFEVAEISALDLAGELIRLAPSEVLAGDNLLSDQTFTRAIEYSGGKTTPIPSAYFDSAAGARDLKACLGVTDLAGFGTFSRHELASIGAVLKYVDLTQMGQKPLIRAPRRAGSASLFIDAASRASLELVKSSSGDKSSSLLGAIDRTITGAGARELLARISSPLTDPAAIEARLDAVGCLLANRILLDDIRFRLRGTPDLARALPRLSFGRGGPRDLAAVRDAIEAASECAELLSETKGSLSLAPELQSIRTRLTGVPASLNTALRNALVDDPPLLKRDGGFVKDGYNRDLDTARELRNDSRRVMAELETRYIEETGIKTLRVRHNNILGFYIEATQLNAKPLLSPPLSERFKHRQTMANAVRFSTAELLETEGQIASASERALSLEQEIFATLAQDIGAASETLGRAAAALAELDVYAALASLALEQGYVRPVTDQSPAFEIRGGRHPVVQQALAKSDGPAFIENDCVLGKGGADAPPGSDELPDARIWLVTGPNMAGKSTFLRQNALITVMAQMGSYVPARSAHIGIVDRLFSRVGASDDLARGRSTFMVEMVETAAILNQATERSLVILDEIGRGTATFDGLSIAWATVEYLHGVTKARALFATHYHELTALARRLHGIANVTMDVTEWHDTIVFLHKVKPGAADRSYGIQVAKLAGLPDTVVTRARQVLERLEKADRRPRVDNEGIDDLPLFSAARPTGAAAAKEPSAVEKLLIGMHPDELSPKAALEKIYELKALAEAQKKTKP
ncbi:DNA mismatch repair protein MutS [Hyphomicrobium sp. 99]|uniref:DNA mismatch repair protein MutS n=1 Tax=Hyphomicrobium sp. 99 TaxID=1163419 RepID=UPI0006964514|nr:DNA mismatch repair protein MutS [Hyphomicrobium sp. 99]